MQDKVKRKEIKKAAKKAFLSKIERRLPFEINSWKKHYTKPILSVDEGRAVLKNAIQAGTPFMAGRFGTSEGATFFRYCQIKLGTKKVFSPQLHTLLCNNAGFFPDKEEYFMQWGTLLETCCPQVDLLGKMDFAGEDWVQKWLCPQAQILPAGGLGSGSNGWADVLEGLNVLVIHPFEESILYQYKNNREKIYPGTNMLPKFNLQTIKAVQTIADNKDERFKTWFEALDWMIEEAKNKDFDVALIGCGAYGFPLGAKIKEMGKIAVQMGGCLQTLFGIKGQRWENHPIVSKEINSAWISPKENERPQGLEKVEQGCYW